MPRPTSKEELLQAASARFSSLWDLIDRMPEDEQTAAFRFDDRDRNVRDVLVHLYEWHRLLLEWVESNQRGVARPFLPAPYNWKTYPQMNVEFWEKHQGTPYAESIEMVRKSHDRVLTLIRSFSDEELFAKRHFPWTGTTTLGSYCVSATSSHYDWAIKKLRKHLARPTTPQLTRRRR